MDRVRWLLITSGGLGLSPVAPGTVGTFGGVAVALLVQWLVPDYAVLAWSAVAVLLFWWGCSQSEYVARTWPKKDPGAFVLDEVVGHLVTLITFVLLARTGALSSRACATCLRSTRRHSPCCRPSCWRRGWRSRTCSRQDGGAVRGTSGRLCAILYAAGLRVF